MKLSYDLKHNVAYIVFSPLLSSFLFPLALARPSVLSPRPCSSRTQHPAAGGPESRSVESATNHVPRTMTKV